ncbi:hypothetical protein M407DRAFT_18572 [Tulasnella calospora MUT 4182]|uniref:F-box domain-containing protein n=1 Tax=Tulasnella calospora MUT 4182 TaxID=1051891 RepID=A0A0C3QV88_9AGAM|nr:hypothetical protein M407DRAFT_18572 [Tulasnella calospora MUT 4182]
MHALTTLQSSIHYENGTVPLKDPLSNACHSQLDYHITAIEAAFAAFRTQSDLHVAHLKRHRNTLAPIHKLPTELLSCILLLSIDRRSYNLSALQKLGRVCKAWHKIVGNTPDFWTRIDFNAPPHVLRLFLQKSKNIGLAIECSMSSNDSVLPSKVEDFIEMTHKYSSRWTSFKYKGNATQRIMRNIESVGKEKLRELSVHFLWHYRQSWLFNLPKGAPLERISLTSASLDWTAACTSQLRNLKSLELKDLHMNPPKLQRMIQIMEASPMLESLVLVGISQDADDASTSAAHGLLEGEPIHLPELHSLLLKTVPLHFHICFLGRIAAPRCQRLIVDAVPAHLFNVSTSSADADAPPPRLFDLARPIIRAAPKLCISAHGRLNHIQFATIPEPLEVSDSAQIVRPGLDLTFETDVPMTDLQRVAEFIGAALSPPAVDPDLLGVQQGGEVVVPQPATQVIVKAGKTSWWDNDQDIVSLPPAALQALHPYLVQLEIGQGVNGTDAVRWLSQPLPTFLLDPSDPTTTPLSTFGVAETQHFDPLDTVPGAYPTPGGTDDEEYPCPRLSRVLLKEWTGDPDAIITFLINRWQTRVRRSVEVGRGGLSEDGYSSSGSSSPSASISSGSGVDSVGPVKLDELSLPNLIPQQLRELYAQGFWKTSRGFRPRRGPYYCPI